MKPWRKGREGMHDRRRPGFEIITPEKGRRAMIGTVRA